jgi:hypothetical protein
MLNRYVTFALAVVMGGTAFGLPPHPIDMTFRVLVTPVEKKQILQIIREISERGGLKCKDAASLPGEADTSVDRLSQCSSETRRAALVITDTYAVGSVSVNAYFDTGNPGLAEGIISKIVSRIRALPGVQIKEISGPKCCP